jgi:hypothetical protein
MAITFDNTGRPTYMFQAGATSTDGVWYAVGAKIDTSSGYEWVGAQTFLNTVTTDATVILRDGFNNFLNPAARDAALTSPAQGTLAFIRQDSGGSPLNQIQFYNGSAWVANDGDINGVTAGTGLSGGGTSGTVTLSVDTTVVATTSNTLTMTNKTLTSPIITGLTLNDSSIIFEGSSADDYETTLTVTNPTADRTITIPNVTGTVVTTGDTGTVSNTMLANSSISINGSSVSLGGSVTISTDPTPSVFLLMGA